jgi:hypothetical protein
MNEPANAAATKTLFIDQDPLAWTSGPLERLRMVVSG